MNQTTDLLLLHLAQECEECSEPQIAVNNHIALLERLDGAMLLAIVDINVHWSWSQ